MHVHSGETHHFSTTKVDEIRQFNYDTACDQKHLLIFTTYHSLHKIQESNIVVDTIYFDEAHNSVQKNFFPATEHFSHFAERCYYFTATPKHSRSPVKGGYELARVWSSDMSSACSTVSQRRLHTTT